MQTTYFPPIDPQKLAPFRALKALLEKNPNLLDDQHCPYDDDTRKFLSQMMSGFGLTTKLAEIPLDTPEDLEQQLHQIYAELMSFGKKVSTTDAGDKIQWAKSVVGILDRLVTLRERVYNLKNYSDFQKRVLDFLEGILDSTQRSQFVENLGRFLHQ